MDSLETQLIEYVERGRERLTAILRDLVRTPCENTPPDGAERACQQYAARLLRNCGWDAELYQLDSVPGLRQHKLFRGGRNYAGRPNMGALRRGAGRGRSLVLSGHIDTVPRGTQSWTRDPFGGETADGRLYGRGSNDMKGGVAANLFVAEALARLGIRLRGDLAIETVVDEEFGGVNGTIAGRLKGYNADAAVIAEPTSLRVCPAQRGGNVAHITLRAADPGILSAGKPPEGTVKQLMYLLDRLPGFAAGRRRTAPANPYYAGSPDPVPVSVTKISTGPWGMQEPITAPEFCKVELYWQLMPGEEEGDAVRQFSNWLDSVSASCPGLFSTRPEVEFPLRCLPGSAIPETHRLVLELAAAGESATGSRPPVAGIEGPCDMFAFHSFGIPAVLFGPTGGNTHAADEYVDIESVVATAKTLLLFVCRWCGVKG